MKGGGGEHNGVEKGGMEGGKRGEGVGSGRGEKGREGKKNEENTFIIMLYLQPLCSLDLQFYNYLQHNYMYVSLASSCLLLVYVPAAPASPPSSSSSWPPGASRGSCT